MGEKNFSPEVVIVSEKNYDVGHFEISSDGVLKSYKRKNEDVETEFIPPFVKKIESRAFMGSKVENIAFLGESPESIGLEAFKDCKRLRSVTLPKGVKSIADGAFCGCEMLERIEIPGGVEKTESETFKDCRSLYRVDIQEGVKGIGERGFFALA